MSERTSDPAFLSGLLKPVAYSHTIGPVHVRETHISWVFLTGEFAYKIKKPVDLGFVNFSTLERRHFFCQEEVRLNRRFADDLYLGVVPIIEQSGIWTIGGAGEAVEFAVQMRQFDEHDLLSRMLAAGRLEPHHIGELANTIAAAHDTADRADQQSEWGTAEHVLAPAVENLDILKPHVVDPARQRQLHQLREWTLQTHRQLQHTWARRRDEGFIRECHGDLHLGNVAVWQGRVTPFDCIEFNPEFRWIDVLNEVAFVVMDLADHRRRDLGWRFLNAYLERTGDYAGLPVLPFYLVYRALVRAKVAALRLQQAGLDPTERERLNTECRGYLDLALHDAAPRRCSLTITHGLSGSGKTTGSQLWIESQGGIRLRSDVERKRLFHIAPDQAAPEESYSSAASTQTYSQLAVLARRVIRAGFPVVVDATFLKFDERHRFRQLAHELGVPFQILAFEAHDDILRARIQSRLAAGRDASDATLAVLAAQRQAVEPLTAVERADVISPATPDTEQTATPGS